MSTDMSTDTDAGALVDPGRSRAVGALATAFYAAAAAGAVIGQTWVAVKRVPWPDGLATGWQIASALPFALVIELLAVVLAVMADHRMRLGERAVAVRIGSAVVAVVATGVIVIGHWPDAYLVVALGALSAAAYLLSLAHMASRRRDALRAAGLAERVTPSYGAGRWLRRPRETARAAEIARTQGVGLVESVATAREQLRAEARRPAIAAAVEAAVRASHPDRRMADIAVRTLDLDRIAAELERSADYEGWAARLAPAVTAPDPDSPADAPTESAGDAPPVYVPDSWVSESLGGESGRDSPTESGGDAPAESAAPRQVTRRSESAPAELIERARESADDPVTRMAWLWHATGGAASGRELARAGDVSPSTGIRRASEWRTAPPDDPRR